MGLAPMCCWRLFSDPGPGIYQHQPLNSLISSWEQTEIAQTCLVFRLLLNSLNLPLPIVALCLSIGVKISGLLTLIKLSSDTCLFRGVGQENVLGQFLSPSREQSWSVTLVAQVSQFPSQTPWGTSPSSLHSKP